MSESEPRQGEQITELAYCLLDDVKEKEKHEKGKKFSTMKVRTKLIENHIKTGE
jgi:hypothetical protein